MSKEFKGKKVILQGVGKAHKLIDVAKKTQPKKAKTAPQVDKVNV